MSDEIKLDSMVKTYLTIRDEREKLAREHDMKDRELANDLAQIEQVLLTSCNEIRVFEWSRRRGAPARY